MKAVLRGTVLAACLMAGSTAVACPLCLNGYTLSLSARELVGSQRSVLAVPVGDESRFKVVSVIRGEPPSGMVVAEPVFRGQSSGGSGKPLLLMRDAKWAAWVNFGPVGLDRATWLRQVADLPEPAGVDDARWRDRVAFFFPYLADPEPLVADIAFGEIARAPYAAMRAQRGRIDRSVVRTALSDPQLVERQSLYTLLLGIAGDASDLAWIEQRLEALRNARDATNLGPLLAADLELRGPVRIDWIDRRYLRDPSRTPQERAAAVAALGIYGGAGDEPVRQQIIRSYRRFMENHKVFAGLVAQDLAAWGYWDAGPQYAALLKARALQDPASRYAAIAYLMQSPRTEAKSAVSALAAAGW